MSVAALIVAAGRGSRVGGNEGPKQYRMIGKAPVLRHVLEAFNSHQAIERIVLVIHPDDIALAEEVVGDIPAGRLMMVHGGETRQSSVLAGLEALQALQEGSPELVLIHDGARPFITHALCDRVIGALGKFQGALPALPVTDTLKRLVDCGNETMGGFETMDRRNIYGAQTPQGFRFSDILEAHRKALASGRSDFTDDASIGECYGLSQTLVDGEVANFKITTIEDLAQADLKLRSEDILTDKHRIFEYRTGTGFDVHRFCDGNEVILCGVAIPHERGLKGHSDADVGLHALTDAVLGAIGAGDIGTHFPPSDVRWKGAKSDQFLSDARERVRALGGAIIHVDVTLICEMPKIGPHRQAMVARIAEILEVEPGRVSVKATTTEGLGFTGRGEGIAAMASATISLPI